MLIEKKVFKIFKKDVYTGLQPFAHGSELARTLSSIFKRTHFLTLKA